ncbi:MAG TPA: DUF72 domain-containing protein [Candidatus Deferrimicrobium sp.]|nr:DUF72 domain-containing protein [Candidatus Deferrimicrobium sp.]
MRPIYIGCGGWSYWQVDRAYQSSTDQLADYATVFNFVEVNNTFYQIPSLADVKTWRNRVPKDFHFSVKCSREISHYHPLESTESNFQTMEKMHEICKLLQAVALIIQTPPRFQPTEQNLSKINEFFAHYKDSKIDLVWESRGENWTSSHMREKLRDILSKLGISHCTDISKIPPVYSANLSYTRIFGLGEKNQWEFDNTGIRVLHEQALELPRPTYVTFHTQRQTYDAARLKAFDETGRLINTTGKYEVNSMLVAIDEYRKYPISKQELLAAHGWKIIDVSPDKQVRANQILAKLPDITFKSKKELNLSLEKIFRGSGQKRLEDVF